MERVMNEEPQKQWKKDLKVYGDGACSLYEFQKDYYEDGVLVDQDWIPAECNYTVQEGLKFHCIRRKKSAKLPFDIERAKAGDEVEELQRGSWIISKTWFHNAFIQDKTVCIPELVNYKISDLRMKYPPNVNP